MPRDRRDRRPSASAALNALRSHHLLEVDLCNSPTLSGEAATSPLLLGTILVVDDEVPLLHLMARSLLVAGYAVHTASGSSEALSLAQDLPNPPDLAVIDLRLEASSGSDLAQELYSRGLAAKFLFVSGYGPDAAYNADFGPFLAKPFSPDQLVNAVAGAVTRE